jgi:hypothetical protein
VRSMLLARLPRTSGVTSAAARVWSSVGDLFGGEVTHGGSAARLDVDETFGLEAVESFADGGLADAELVGEELLGKAEGGFEAAGKHALFDTQIGHLCKIRSFWELAD